MQHPIGLEACIAIVPVEHSTNRNWKRKICWPVFSHISESFCRITDPTTHKSIKLCWLQLFPLWISFVPFKRERFRQKLVVLINFLCPKRAVQISALTFKHMQKMRPLCLRRIIYEAEVILEWVLGLKRKAYLRLHTLLYSCIILVLRKRPLRFY